MEVFLQDRDLHFELVDSVLEEEDFLGLGVDIPVRQALEVSLTHRPENLAQAGWP